MNNPELMFLSNHANWKTQALLVRTGVDVKLNQRGDQTVLQLVLINVLMEGAIFGEVKI